MSEELINELTARYVSGISRPFKKIAERAYKDGLRDAVKMNKHLQELENTEFDYGHSTNVRDDDY